MGIEMFSWTETPELTPAEDLAFYIELEEKILNCDFIRKQSAPGLSIPMLQWFACNLPTVHIFKNKTYSKS